MWNLGKSSNKIKAYEEGNFTKGLYHSEALVQMCGFVDVECCTEGFSPSVYDAKTQVRNEDSS